MPTANLGLDFAATFVETAITLTPMVSVLLLINHARPSTQPMETALLALQGGLFLELPVWLPQSSPLPIV